MWILWLEGEEYWRVMVRDNPANDNKNQNIHLNVSVDSSIGPTDIKKQISQNP